MSSEDEPLRNGVPLSSVSAAKILRGHTLFAEKSGNRRNIVLKSSSTVTELNPINEGGYA
jgi:hypothetical protein